MEIEVGENDIVSEEFKIDLIVWKCSNRFVTSLIASKFKIDLIVWKFSDFIIS